MHDALARVGAGRGRLAGAAPRPIQGGFGAERMDPRNANIKASDLTDLLIPPKGSLQVLCAGAPLRSALSQHALDYLPQRQDLGVAPARPGQHQTDGRLACAVAGQRQRAAVEKIDQCRVAQDQAVGGKVG